MTEANNTWETLLAQEEKKEQDRLATIRKHVEAGVVFLTGRQRTSIRRL